MCVDGSMDGGETLSRFRRFETLHLALTPSDRLVRILCSIVRTKTLLMTARKSERSQRRAVGSKLVSDDGRWNEALLLEQFSEQFQCGDFVTPTLDQDIEHLAFAVDRSPHIHVLSGDRDHHLIEIPSIMRLRSGLAQIPSDLWAELQNPSADRFVADVQSSFGQQILDVTIAQCEPQIEPDRVPNNVRRDGLLPVSWTGS